MTEPTTTTNEDIAKTLAEYERLAISTGEFAGAAAPEFSGKGVKWSPAWPSGGEAPGFARATVFRSTGSQGVTVVLGWDEVAPEDDETRGEWEKRPMIRFGAAALRRAYQRAFADVIQPEPPAEVKPEPPIKRDWAAALLKATTEHDVKELHKEAQRLREVDPLLEQAFRGRLAALSAPRPERPVAASSSRRVEATSSVAVPKPPAPGVPRLEEIQTKPVGKRAKSRASRDSGRRGGGRKPEAA